MVNDVSQDEITVSCKSVFLGVGATLWIFKSIKLSFPVTDNTISLLKPFQANCQRSDYLPSQVSHFSQRMTAGQEPGSCNILKTLVVYKDDKKCFSTQPVVDCKAGCDPQSQAYKNVSFLHGRTK